jgi:hypothetical protein
MTDEVIEHLNRQSASRKINKTNNVRQPVSEQNKRILENDDSDYVDDLENDNEEHGMIYPHHLPHEEEHEAQELEHEFYVPDDIRDDTPGQHESVDNTDQLIEEIDSDANESVQYDNTPQNNQALLDDIFGTDSDEEIDESSIDNLEELVTKISIQQ